MAISATDRSADGPRRPRLRGRLGTRVRWATAVVALVSVPLLSGCATSFGAATNQLYQPGPGIEERTSDVYIINAVIVTDGHGHGTLVASFMNQVHPADRIVSLTATSSTGKRLTVTGAAGLVLATRQAVQVADLASAGYGGIRLTGTLTAGTVATVHVTFHNAAPVTMPIPVVSRTQQFSNVNVAPAPTPAG